MTERQYRTESDGWRNPYSVMSSFLFYFIYLCLSLCLKKVPTLVCWYTVLPNHAVWFPVASSFVLKNNNSICSCGSRRCYNCGRVEKCNTSRCVWFICSFLLLRRLSKFSLPSFLCPGVHSPPPQHILPCMCDWTLKACLRDGNHHSLHRAVERKIRTVERWKSKNKINKVGEIEFLRFIKDCTASVSVRICKKKKKKN